MMQDKYHQYHVYNEHISIIVTIGTKDDEYATIFGKRTAVDFFEATQDQLDNVKCEYICSFFLDSAISVNHLNKAVEHEKS
ncbi:hypothetical protein ACQKJG_18505 [Priestia megaterium]|uniref:hypothetical protein n=1 Tax=Priestia megaterium TaxID=1404 RepID=UPI003D00EE69